ncbi:MAG: cold shock domain-containing protein [Actinobacteria bacterium]|nr:cold shock domain-containing protein [Actinomycetota bacterium]
MGMVVDFDAFVGLGRVRTDDGAEYMFHCAEIADGSRDIAVGTRVSFRLVSKFGREEAAAVTPT